MIPLDLKFLLIYLPFRAIRLCEFRSPSRSSLPAAALLQKHNSCILNHLRTLQKLDSPQLFSHQSLAHSFAKTRGYGGRRPTHSSSLTGGWPPSRNSTHITELGTTGTVTPPPNLSLSIACKRFPSHRGYGPSPLRPLPVTTL